MLPRRGRSGAIAGPAGLAKGTRIATTAGYLPVEAIEPGMLVHTHDAGAQPVLAVLSSPAPAGSRDAPVTLPAGCLGTIHGLTLNPQHCIAMTSRQCPDLFGAAEVFVPALFLAGAQALPTDAPSVVYQLLFREHQVICANGVKVESFYAGPAERQALDAESTRRVAQVLPDLDDPLINRYGPRARLRVTRREFEVLMRLGDGLTLSRN